MKTFSNDIDIPEAKLRFLRQWMKTLPLGYSTKMRWFNRVDRLMQWVNLRFYNLPETYPEDFSIERTASSTRRKLKNRKDLSIQISGNTVTRVEQYYEYKPDDQHAIKGYLLTNEIKEDLPITESEKKELYRLVRKVGFLHFEQENSDVSFDDHGSAVYTVKAHGVEYIFIDATECPLDEFWRPNCTALDIAINKLAGIETPPDPSME